MAHTLFPFPPTISDSLPCYMYSRFSLDRFGLDIIGDISRRIRRFRESREVLPTVVGVQGNNKHLLSAIRMYFYSGNIIPFFVLIVIGLSNWKTRKISYKMQCYGYGKTGQRIRLKLHLVSTYSDLSITEP